MQQTGSTISVGYWHWLDDGRIQCDLCPRYCKLREGQHGLCFVRARENDSMVLTTYGRSSGFCIDPVEKKPLNHFLPGSSVLSFGTAGCNLACKFCQNWDISKSTETAMLASQAMPEDIARVAAKYQCQSVAFTYNDPVIFTEYAIDVAQACHEQDIKTIAVTAGYICEQPRQDFFKHMDAANIDLKAFNEQFYYKLTGGHLQPVLETLEYLQHETSVWFEITTLLIPGENDSDREINALTEWVAEHLGTDIPIHFSAFHPDWKMQNVPATSRQILIRAGDIAKKNQLKYVYIGNVHDRDNDTTYCHKCGNKLIVRDWYEIISEDIDDSGHCKKCATLCAGVFAGPVGRWGAKRLPINMALEREQPV